MKEPEIKKTDEDHIFGRFNKRRFYIVVIVVLILVMAALLFYLYKTKKTAAPPTNTDQSGTISAVEDNPTNTNDQPATELPPEKTAADYFTEGQNFMSEGKWSDAINSFDQAITLDDKNPDYYNRKSQAQYNLNQKQEAIDTINAGLVTNPNSDLLKSRLDILEKDYFNSQPQ
jgi:tetratricopeptide (TPR) repeat protein